MTKDRKIRSELKTLRKKRCMTRAEMAVELGISEGYYGEIENGYKTPSLKLAIKISESLGINIKVLS